MSRRKIKVGSTSQTVPVFVQDTSSTVGAGLGSLVFNTSGLAAKYRREGASTWTTISLVTATVGTWTSGGFVSDGGPVTGGYEFGVPDAVLASGATWAEVAIYGATNMLAVLLEFELDAVNYQSNTGFLASVPAVVGAVGSVAGNVVGSVGGNVAGNVGGDVQGKVLGGGSSSLTAVGVQADVEQWAGHAALVDGNNFPKVNVTDWNGTAVGSLPANFPLLVIDGSGRVDLSKWNGVALAGTIPPDSVFIRSGTAQAGASSSITLDSGASSVNNFYTASGGCIVFIRSGTGAGQCGIATAYNGTTKVLTISGTWAVQPDSSSVFSLLPFGNISATVSGNVTVGGYVSGQDPATYILSTPAQKLATDASGRVNVGAWLDHAVLLDANNLPQIAVRDWNGVAVGSLPANFPALGISAGGHISNVDLTATTTNVTNVVPLPTVDGKTMQQAMQIIAAMVAGKLPSGAGSGTESYIGLDSATTRVTMTIDGSGNRTACSYS